MSSTATSQNTEVLDEETKATASAEVEANDEPEEETYVLEGVEYTSYQDMVVAKRRRNQRVLEQLGLLEVVRESRQQQQMAPSKRTGLLKKRKATAPPPTQERRQSSRQVRIPSDGGYVDERAGRFTVVTEHGTAAAVSSQKSSDRKRRRPFGDAHSRSNAAESHRSSKRSTFGQVSSAVHTNRQHQQQQQTVQDTNDVQQQPEDMEMEGGDCSCCCATIIGEGRGTTAGKEQSKKMVFGTMPTADNVRTDV